MVYKIIIQQQAENDIGEIYQYISEFSLKAASVWRLDIKSAIISLSSFPKRCPLAPESEKLGYELRQMICGKRTACYRIIFRVIDEKQEFHILTIRHAARKQLEIEDL